MMPGKMFTVENYILRYDHDNQKPIIVLMFRDEGGESHVTLHPPWEGVTYIADLLRHEKPVFWSPQENILTTRRERVGEEEGR
jgi:hypothetical protein